jgi:deoxyribonuclease V
VSSINGAIGRPASRSVASYPQDVFAAVDVQYLASGEARAALVGTTSAAFAEIVAERTVMVGDVAPYVPVIGVAKTRFATATHAVPVMRGSTGTMNPLFVTAAGLPVAEAGELVRAMAGRYRLPDALRRVDALARGHQTSSSSPGLSTS